MQAMLCRRYPSVWEFMFCRALWVALVWVPCLNGCQRGQLTGTSRDIVADTRDGGVAEIRDALDATGLLDSMEDVPLADEGQTDISGETPLDGFELDIADDAPDAPNTDGGTDVDSTGVQLCPGTAFPPSGTLKYSWDGSPGSNLCPFESAFEELEPPCFDVPGVGETLAMAFPPPARGYPIQEFFHEWTGPTIQSAWLRVRAKLASSGGHCQVRTTLRSVQPSNDFFAGELEFVSDLALQARASQNFGWQSQTYVLEPDWFEMSLAITETGFHVCAPDGSYEHNPSSHGPFNSWKIEFTYTESGGGCEPVFDRIELWVSE